MSTKANKLTNSLLLVFGLIVFGIIGWSVFQQSNGEPEISCDRKGEIIGENPENISICDLPKCVAPTGAIANQPCFSPEGVVYF